MLRLIPSPLRLQSLLHLVLTLGVYRQSLLFLPPVGTAMLLFLLPSPSSILFSVSV